MGGRGIALIFCSQGNSFCVIYWKRKKEALNNNNNNNNNKDFYLRECSLDVHLFSIRPSTQQSLTTITT